MECDLLAGSVKAYNIKNRVTVIKNVGCTVGKGDKKFVFHFQRLCFHAQVCNAARINADKRSVVGVAIKKAICKHPLAKFAVSTVKTGAMQYL